MSAFFTRDWGERLGERVRHRQHDAMRAALSCALGIRCANRRLVQYALEKLHGPSCAVFAR